MAGFGAMCALVVMGLAQPPAAPLLEISDASVTDLKHLDHIEEDEGAGGSLFSPGSTSTTLSTSSDSTTTTAGAPIVHQVTLVLATWSGLPADGDAVKTRAELTNLINTQVSGFWETATNGAVAFQVADSHGWITTTNKACENGSWSGTLKFWEEIRNRIGFTSGTGKHLLVYFPRTDCGGTAGMATVSSIASLSSGGSVWINGSKMRSLYAHELGHNLGLGHSNTLICTAGGNRVTDAPASSCTSKDYADITDVMGVSHQNAGALSPVHLRTLGLLKSPDVQDITLSSTIEIAPLSSPPAQGADAAPRVARVAIGSDTYFIVNRATTGLDSWLTSTTGNGDPGVAIYRVPASGFDPRSSYLADADPATLDATYATTKTILDVGRSVSLQNGAMTIRTAGISNGRAIVEFTRAGETQTSLNPTDETSLEDLGPAPELAFTRWSVATGTVSKSGTTWTAPITATWTSTAPLTGQVFDGVPLAAEARLAPTRLNLGSNKALSDRLDLAATSISGNANLSQKLTGLIRTDDPQSGRVAYSGSWTRRADSGAHAGAVRVSSTSGSRITLTTTGRSFGIVAQRGVNHGVFDVYINGVKKASVNLEASSTAKRRVVYRIGYNNVATRAVVLVHRGSGVVPFDGLVELN
jgi:hypothetical protein